MQLDAMLAKMEDLLQTSPGMYSSPLVLVLIGLVDDLDLRHLQL